MPFIFMSDQTCLFKSVAAQTDRDRSSRTPRGPHHSGDDKLPLVALRHVVPDIRFTPIQQAGRFLWLLETMENITDGSEMERRYQRPDGEGVGGRLSPSCRKTEALVLHNQ